MKNNVLKIPAYKDILRLSLPIILSLMAENVVNVTDTIFLSSVGEAELGASAIGGTFYVLLFIVGLGFGIGTQIIISRRMGQGLKNQAGRVMEAGLVFLLMAALIIFLVVQLFFAPLFSFIISSPEVFEKTSVYVHYRTFGIFFTFAACAFRAFFTGIFKTGHLAVNSVILAVVNLFFAYVLIFGKWGFPKSGIQGAAIATVIAEAASMVYYLLILVRKKYRLNYGLFSGATPSKKIMLNIIRVSGFVVFQHLLSLTAWFSFFLIIERRGEHALAVTNVVRSIYIFLMIPAWAFSSATNTMVSNIIGQSYPQGVIKLTGKITLMTFLVILLTVVPVAVFPRALLSLYSDNPQFIADCMPSLWVVLATLIVLSLTMNYYSAVMGTGNTRMSFFIEIAGVSIYVVYVIIAVLIFKWPLHYAWLAESLYFMSIWALSVWYLKKGRWKEKSI